MPNPIVGESKEKYLERCIPIVMKENAEMSSDQAAAICNSKFEKGADSAKEKIEQMNMIDVGSFEDSAVIRDDDQYLVVHAVLASEMVQPYLNQNTGKTEQHYKSADELEKATFTFRGIPIKTLSHPKGSHIEDRYEVNGRVENPSFRKDLIDPKTKRPCRRGVDGDLYFYRDNAPEVKAKTFTPITEALAEQIRKGTLKDNSIGFTSWNSYSAGEFQGQHFDVRQTRIYANHLAAPIEKGRCPSPYCGINADSAEPNFGMDAAKIKECPVCLRIKEQGFGVAGERLYKFYGPDVLEVIEGHPLPPPANLSDSTDLIQANRDALEKLKPLFAQA